MTFFQDSSASIKKKLKKAFCEPGNITDNGILSFCKYVIIPVVLRGQDFVVERAPENGGNTNFSSYEVGILVENILVFRVNYNICLSFSPLFLWHLYYQLTV
jgi:hypothetical protein